MPEEMLAERGVAYHHSLMRRDAMPHHVRTGDAWTPVEYSKPAESWMNTSTKGRETDLVEIPASGYLGDLPPMMFIKGFQNSQGHVPPRRPEDIWRDHFDFVCREHDRAAVPMTMHPDVSGRPQVLLMLERLIAHMLRHPGVRFVALEEMARDLRRGFPRR